MSLARVAAQRMLGESAGRWFHLGGHPAAACEGESHQSSAARDQSAAPLPPLLAPSSLWGWSEGEERCEGWGSGREGFEREGGK